MLSLMPHRNPTTTVDITPGARGPDWQPDVKEELRLQSAGNSREMPPYIRRTVDNRLWITVAEPIERDKHTVGIVLLTREAQEVEESLLSIRLSIIALFGVALALTVLLSWYMSLTIARPILRLAVAASDMREGRGGTGSVPVSLLARRDEVGELANAVSDSAIALWARMDATERFAADVAHELKNPLSSIRSAIETLMRIEDAGRRKQLLTIIGQDVMRLDRLISDVSDASRVDAEMSRVTAEPVDVVPILRTLKELDDATRDPDNDPGLEVVAPPAGMRVLAVEDRLVQVLRNLIGNAHSFSPRKGRILARVKDLGARVEISVEDQGPGIPEANLEHIFDRFYSERPKARNSVSTPGWACRSAGRSWRRWTVRSRPRTCATMREKSPARASSSGCRRRERRQHHRFHRLLRHRRVTLRHSAHRAGHTILCGPSAASSCSRSDA